MLFFLTNLSAFSSFSSFSSLTWDRKMRFMHRFKKVMKRLFIDTLFYFIFLQAGGMIFRQVRLCPAVAAAPGEGRRGGAAASPVVRRPPPGLARSHVDVIRMRGASPARGLRARTLKSAAAAAEDGFGGPSSGVLANACARRRATQSQNP